MEPVGAKQPCPDTAGVYSVSISSCTSLSAIFLSLSPSFPLPHSLFLSLSPPFLFQSRSLVPFQYRSLLAPFPSRSRLFPVLSPLFFFAVPFPRPFSVPIFPRPFSVPLPPLSSPAPSSFFSLAPQWPPARSLSASLILRPYSLSL